MTATEQPGGTIPPCELCRHRWHGFPCTVGIGQRAEWGRPAELKTCDCPGVWGLKETA